MKDIDDIMNILNNNNELNNKDIKKYFKHKKVDNVFKLFRLSKFKPCENLEDYIKQKEKKAIYFQINRNIFVYLDYDRNISYCLVREQGEVDREFSTTFDEMLVLEGDDITLLDANIFPSDGIKKAVQQP